MDFEAVIVAPIYSLSVFILNLYSNVQGDKHSLL